MIGLAGADNSFTGQFSRFAPREKVALVTFDDHVRGVKTFSIDSSDPASASLQQVRDYINGLEVGGNTAIYSALSRADDEAAQLKASDPSSYTSIVLLTDGENNSGIGPETYLAQIKRLQPADVVRTFTVLFGEANPSALQAVADATGGKVFDARQADLSKVFKEIRGYQ
jgi:Ca-activated chloride channel family protein